MKWSNHIPPAFRPFHTPPPPSEPARLAPPAHMAHVTQTEGPKGPESPWAWHHPARGKAPPRHRGLPEGPVRQWKTRLELDLYIGFVDLKRERNHKCSYVVQYIVRMVKNAANARLGSYAFEQV